MFHTKNIQDTLDELVTSASQGIPEDEVKERLKEYGKNKLPEPKQESTFHKIFKQFTDLLVVILILAAIISFVLEEYLDGSVILGIVFINGILGYIQEARAEKAIEALKELSTQQAQVVRGGAVKEVPVEELVPGDIILLESGDKVPADARLVEVVSLQISEAVLTGESNAVTKEVEKIAKEDIAIGDRKNMVYKDTSVVAGRGRAVVTATGDKTEIGKISAMLSDTKQEETPLGKELNVVGKRLSGAAGITIIVIFGIAKFLQGMGWEETFLTAISLAVAAIPEGLPAVVTITLAIGVSRLAKHKAIIRRLQAVETLGSTNYVLTDKTGTLTQNKMTATNVATPKDSYEVITSKNNIKTFVSQRGKAITYEEDERLELLLKNAFLCNDAEFNIEGEKIELLGDPTETALVELVHYSEIDIKTLQKTYKRIFEIPFSSETKRMLTVHENPENKDELVVFAKGAPEIIKEQVSDYGASIEQINDIYAKEGLRNLAFSYKTISKEEYAALKEENKENKLSGNHKYLGMISQKDPLREEVKEAMELARAAGIKSIMITGDHKLTAASIARELSLIESDDEVMDGITLGNKTEEELAEILKKVKVFARVSPEQKLNIVNAVKKQGYITAVTGDGVNDAPAIKSADIGISMGITGTDVSKEVSDMVLQDDNYATIIKAIEQGRIIYDNLVKFITYLISCNIAEILVVAIAMIFGPISALLPIHILWINLVTDGAPALALSMEPGESDVMNRQPRAKGHLLTNERWTGILFQSILITLGTTTVFFVGLGQSPAVAQTAAFTTLAASELIRSLNNRSEKHSIFAKELKPNFMLYWTIIISLFVQMLIVYTSLGNTVLKTVPLGGDMLLLCMVCGLLPLIGVEFYKYSKR